MNPFQGKPVVSFDLETHLVQPGLLTPPIVCASFCTSLTEFWLETDKKEIFWYIKQFLLDEFILAGANIAYDFGCVAATWPELLPLIFAKCDRGEVFDTTIGMYLHAIYHGQLEWFGDGVASGIYDPRTQKRLHNADGKLATRFNLQNSVWITLGRMDAKDNAAYRKSYALLGETPLTEWPPEARQYPLDDAKNTYDLAVEMIARYDNLGDMAPQADFAWCAHLASIWGMRTDPERVNKLSLEAEHEYGLFLNRYRDIGFLRPDLTEDSKRVKEAVRKAYGGNPPLTAKGAISTARPQLEKSGDPILAAFGAGSKIQKVVETYVPFLRAASTCPVNVKVNPLLATGRASFEGLIQLLPRKGGIRECFKFCGAGIACDYTALEMATLGQAHIDYFDDSPLADAINSGLDLHCTLAAEMSPYSYEEILKNKEDHGFFEHLRWTAKAGNFGYGGGMGAAKFAETIINGGATLCHSDHDVDKDWYTLGFGERSRKVHLCSRCVDTAEIIRKAYYKKWQMERYFKRIKRELRENDNRIQQLRVERARGNCGFTQAANTIFQGLGADGAKASVRAISRECYLYKKSPLYGSRLCVFAHDENIIDTPPEKVEGARQRLEEVMRQAMRIFTPDVNIKVSSKVMEYWTK